MRVLVACEFSGLVRDAFISRGHHAMSCDLLPTERPGPHYEGDVMDVLDGDWDLMIAHPECTRLTNAGVRWLTGEPPRGKTKEQMWHELEQGVKFYKQIRAANIPRKAIENPVMHPYAMERLGITKRHIVQPWWFGDPFFKATGWELHGLEPLRATNKLVPPKKGTFDHKKWSAVHLASPGPNRAKERSRSFPGMCAAMADQWGIK